MHLYTPFVLSFAGVAIATGCNEDNCLRALIGTRRGPEWPKTASTDCVKYLQATVTPSPVTIITTTTVTPGPTAPLAKRAGGPIPDYASACSGAVRYSSACSCLGVLPTTFTAPTPVSAQCSNLYPMANTQLDNHKHRHHNRLCPSLYQHHHGPQQLRKMRYCLSCRR